MVLFEHRQDVALLQLFERGRGRGVGRLFVRGGLVQFPGRRDGRTVNAGGFEPAVAGAVEGHFQFAKRAGLAEEVDHVEADGLLGGVEVAEAGEDDRLRGGPAAAGLLEEFKAADAGEVEVDDEDVEPAPRRGARAAWRASAWGAAVGTKPISWIARVSISRRGDSSSTSRTSSAGRVAGGGCAAGGSRPHLLGRDRRPTLRRGRAAGRHVNGEPAAAARPALSARIARRGSRRSRG